MAASGGQRTKVHNRTLPARATVVAALAGAAFILALTPALGAGSYIVAQCHPQNRAHEAIFSSSLAYNARNGCSSSAHEFSIQLNNTANADNGRYARALWEVPSTALGIVRVEVEAKLRRDANHRSRLYMTDSSGTETARVATGDTGATGFEPEIWSGSRQPGFGAILVCESNDGCPQAQEPKTWVRNVKFTVGDYSDPTFGFFSGSLIDSGWLRGTQRLTARAVDVGSGVRRISARVNGVELREETASCPGIVPGTTTIAARFVPCGSDLDLDITAADTAAAPFRDGANTLSVCGYDFAVNPVCEGRTVMVDNTPPGLAFANSQDPDDPELIRASVSDPHSGVASADLFFRPAGGSTWQRLETSRVGDELRARVDSASLPDGDYEFMAEATDVAGNTRQTTKRQNGRPMVLRFPLRTQVELRANLEPSGASRQTVRYGRNSFVSGQLRAADGAALAGQEIMVIERFDDGALVPERSTLVRTDEDGRWTAKLGSGPSRLVLANFDGSSRYLDAETEAGQLRVRSKAKFKTSRKQVPEGGRVKFTGKVKHFGAKIPPGGKLVELQVRERAGRWQTVREAFYTKPSGRYGLGYRFGRFYQADALFRFRLKVTREQGWPYKAPVRSKSRKVILRAR